MSSIRALLAICSAVVAFGASAQQPQQPNPMDVVPDKMPNDIPYGTPISLGQAQGAINAAVAGSDKRGRKPNIPKATAFAPEAPTATLSFPPLLFDRPSPSSNHAR